MNFQTTNLCDFTDDLDDLEDISYSPSSPPPLQSHQPLPAESKIEKTLVDNEIEHKKQLRAALRNKISNMRSGRTNGSTPHQNQTMRFNPSQISMAENIIKEMIKKENLDIQVNRNDIKNIAKQMQSNNL